VSDATVD